MSKNYYVYEGNLRDRNKFVSSVNNSSGSGSRYFSSLDTEVYFGQKQIHEIVAIDFTISEPKLPIYGYNSFYPNRIVSGRRTVQGTFAINFTNTNYLINVLNEIDDSIMKSEYESLVYRCPGEDSTGLGIGNSALFDKQFDITISYGYGKNGEESSPYYYKGCYQTLVGVQIVEYRQALDTEGNPILDMYSFIAKDIHYAQQETASSESASSDSGSTSSKGTNIKNDDIKLTGKWLVANAFDTDAITKLEAHCKDNPNNSGFKITPTFKHSEGRYYLSLSIESTNNKTSVFTNVSMRVSDGSGINSSYTFKNITNGGSMLFELLDSNRNTGALLYKNYKTNKNYRPKCDITFTAKINDKDTKITLKTFLYPDKYLK